MAKKLPKGFSSWIAFHDYLKKTKPELFREKTIRFMCYLPQGGVREEYSVQIATIERNCWLELQRYRMDKERSTIVQHWILSHQDRFHAEYTEDAINLLRLTEINNN